MSNLIGQYVGTQWIALNRLPPSKEGGIDFKAVTARGALCLVLRDGNILMSRITRTVWGFDGQRMVGVEEIEGGVLIDQVYVCTQTVGPTVE